MVAASLISEPVPQAKVNKRAKPADSTKRPPTEDLQISRFWIMIPPKNKIESHAALFRSRSELSLKIRFGRE
jgi:hypothetical protein